MGCALSRTRLAGCVIIYIQLYCGTGIDISKYLKNCSLKCVLSLWGGDVYVFVCLCDVCACCMTYKFDMQVIKGYYGILFSMETFWLDHN